MLGRFDFVAQVPISRIDHEPIDADFNPIMEQQLLALTLVRGFVIGMCRNAGRAEADRMSRLTGAEDSRKSCEP